jgi:hypothetical protein
VQLAAGKRGSIEARLGYMGADDKSTTTGSTPSKLDSEVMASDTISDLPASFTWEQWKDWPGVTIVVHLDIGRLHFKPWQGRRTQELTIVAVVLDERGSFVAGKRSDLQLSFKSTTFDQLSKTGFPVAMTIPVPAGVNTMRAVAQDALDNKIAAASGKIEIQ